VIATVSGGEPITRDGAREAARRELSKGIYHRNDEPLAVRVFNAVQRWISHLFHTVSKHAPGGGAGAIALLLAAIVLLGLVWWRVGLVRRTASLQRPVLDSRRTTSGDLLREAEAAVVAGRWDDAVVARMRALALGLEERGVVDTRPGRTADELAAEVGRSMPAATAALRAAASAFDAVAYGRRPATRDTYDVIVAAADMVEHEQRGRRLLAAGDPR
jgi:hypothetical protein